MLNEMTTQKTRIRENIVAQHKLENGKSMAIWCSKNMANFEV